MQNEPYFTFELQKIVRTSWKVRSTCVIAILALILVSVSTFTDNWRCGITSWNFKNGSYGYHGRSLKANKIRVCSGLWRICCIQDSCEFSCQPIYVNPVHQQGGFGAFGDIIDAMRRSNVFPISSIVFAFTGLVAFLGGVFMTKQRSTITVLTGILFVLSGLMNMVGLVIYSSKNSQSYGLSWDNTYYGWSFYLAGLAFALSQCAGVMTIKLTNQAASETTELFETEANEGESQDSKLTGINPHHDDLFSSCGVVTGTLKSPNAGNRSVEIFTRDEEQNQDIPAPGLQQFTEAAIPPFANQTPLSDYARRYLPANSPTIPYPSHTIEGGNKLLQSMNCKCCLQYTHPGKRYYKDNISTRSWYLDDTNHPDLSQSARTFSASSIRPCLKYVTTSPRQSGIRNQPAKEFRQLTAVKMHSVDELSFPNDSRRYPSSINRHQKPKRALNHVENKISDAPVTLVTPIPSLSRIVRDRRTQETGDAFRRKACSKVSFSDELSFDSQSPSKDDTLTKSLMRSPSVSEIRRSATDEGLGARNCNMPRHYASTSNCADTSKPQYTILRNTLRRQRRLERNSVSDWRDAVGNHKYHTLPLNEIDHPTMTANSYCIVPGSENLQNPNELSPGRHIVSQTDSSKQKIAPKSTPNSAEFSQITAKLKRWYSTTAMNLQELKPILKRSKTLSNIHMASRSASRTTGSGKGNVIKILTTERLKSPKSPTYSTAKITSTAV